jgi:hypothetical protein
MKKILLTALAAGSIAAGCATTATESGTEPAAQRPVREFTTGSNIPKRTPASQVKYYDREEFERARDKMPQGVKAGPGGGPPM